MSNLFQDIRYSVRALAKSPGFTVVAVLTVALGISGITATFSLVNAFFFRPLPFAQPDQLVHVWQTDTRRGDRELRASVPNYDDWRTQATSFHDLGGYFYQSYSLALDEPVQVQVGRVTPNLMQILGMEPAIGRRFTEDEGRAGRDTVVLLSHGFWQKHFAGSRDVLGKTVTLDRAAYTVIGVMPPEFVFPLKATQLWAPLPLDEWKQRRDLNGPLLVVGRMKPGVSREHAQTELTALMQRLERDYPTENKNKGANVVPLRHALLFFYDMLQVTFAALFLAHIFVLLIVCANVGNLLLARAAARNREMAIRAALGAGRLRLVRQLMTESLLLVLMGGTAGVIAALWVVPLMAPALPDDLYRVGEIRVDGAALLVTLVASVFTALLFGLTPALQATKLDLTDSLRQSASTTGGARVRRTRGILVVSQVTLATVLLAGSALAVQSFVRLQNASPGFDPANLLAIELNLPENQYAEPAQQNQFYDSLLERLRALPGVQSAAAGYPLPLNFESLSQSFLIEGRPAEPGQKLYANAFWVTPGFFRTMRIPQLGGRDFDGRDTATAPHVVVINQRMAERYWPGEDAIGKQVLLSPGTPRQVAARVVGVVGNTAHFLLNENSAELMYMPQQQRSTERRFVLLRTAGDPTSLAGVARKEVWALDPYLPIAGVRSMNKVVEESLAPWSGGATGLGALGAVALGLAGIGIYGVISVSVSQRTREMAIRMALGAQRRDLLRMVLRQGVQLAGIGAAVGLVGAVAMTHFLQVLLFGVSPLDPVTFLGTPMVLLGVALLACYFPARRATRVDPMVALRYE